ncbi:MAG: type II toxin-antitoxin system VapC family toxin [Nitrospinae bacterium]|nr:type II toxin-antitoxin system VapC family toxin [Nitrospinota bacterium]MBI3813894.1 type II toxin-antitoxin system VapC family toxin [Nitrospinota bacterium]
MFVLDSFAMLCLFDRKRKRENRAIRKYLEDAENGRIKLYLSKINEGEIFYKLYKYLGESVAIGFREDLKHGIVPVNVVSVNDKRVERASEIKSKYPVSYADAFCIELAREMNLPVITGDPEFKNVGEIIKIVWI